MNGFTRRLVLTQRLKATPTGYHVKKELDWDYLETKVYMIDQLSHTSSSLNLSS